MLTLIIPNSSIDCDRKVCGLGRRVSAGNYLCGHNNLAVKRVLTWLKPCRSTRSYVRMGSRKKYRES